MNAGAQPGGGRDDARIYDQGYRPYQGGLASPHSRFAAITANQFRQAWKDKWFKRLLWLAFIPLVVFCVLVVVRARFRLGGGHWDVWSHFWGIQMFFSMLMVFFVGRNAVGEDLRTGALVLYFSRPVSFVQYLVGKWLAIALGVVGVTLAPGLVLAVFKWMAEPGTGFVQFLGWVGSLLVLALLVCLSLGAVMLAVSSVTRRGRAAGIIWIVMFFVLMGVSQGAAQAADIHALEALSYTQASIHLAGYFLEGRGPGLDALWFAAGQLAWIVVGLAVVLFQLRRWTRA